MLLYSFVQYFKNKNLFTDFDICVNEKFANTRDDFVLFRETPSQSGEHPFHLTSVNISIQVFTKTNMRRAETIAQLIYNSLFVEYGIILPATSLDTTKSYLVQYIKFSNRPYYVNLSDGNKTFIMSATIFLDERQ